MSTQMHHETKPCLYEDSDELADEEGRLPTLARPRRSFSLPVVALTILLALNIPLLLWNLHSLRNRTCGSPNSESLPGTFTPAQSAIEYIVDRVDTHDPHSPFIGKPRLELDEAWSKLLHPTILSFSEDEMRMMNRTSIATTDGRGYVGYPEAYHMLHCVKRMYQFQYPEHYPIAAERGQLSITHWEHCLEVLRKGIMCNADPSINTYTWDRTTPTEVEGHSDGPRKCVDWTKFESWSLQRALGVHWRDQLVPSGGEGGMGPMDLLA